MTDDQQADELKKTIRATIVQAFFEGKRHRTDEVDFPVDLKTHEIMQLITTYIEDIEIQHVKELEEMHDLIAYKVQEANRRTLETVSALLNGDNNQINVVKGYVDNKLKMIAELQSLNHKERGRK